MAMGEMMGITPTYDVNKCDGGGMGGNWIWIILFILLLGGNGGGLFGGGNSATNAVNTDFQFANLGSKIDSVNGQVFGLSKDIYQGFAQTAAQTAAGFCAVERNIDAVRYEAAQNTCAITSAIHADGEATRALINANTMQELRDQLQASQFQLSQMSQTANLVNQLKPCAIPAYLTCSPYDNGCGTC